MAAPVWVRNEDGSPKKWAGGRIVQRADGQKFVIERQVGTVKYSVTLDTTDLNQAMAELALFSRDPAGYKSPQKHRVEQAERSQTLTGVVWTNALVEDFILSCHARVRRGEMTDKYVTYTLHKYLADWSKRLGGRDLRSLRLADLKHALKAWKGVAEDKRITSIKAFSAWLRQEGKLDRSDDPTLDLIVPQAVAGKDLKNRDYPIELVEAVYSKLSTQPVRDAILMRAKAGMHHTEIQRLRAAELRKIEDPSGIYGTIVFHHKRGTPLNISVDEQTFSAARRLAKAGAPDHKTVWKHMQFALEACDVGIQRLAGGKTVTPERLRHSFGTWARTVGVEVKPSNQSGISVDRVAEHMGHTNQNTTKRHYLGEHVREMVVLPIRLEHPDDP